MQIRNENSISRLMVNLLLDHGKNKIPIDRKAIIKEVSQIRLSIGLKPITPGAESSSYKELGYVLHFIRTKSNKFMFDTWIKSIGLEDYLNSIEVNVKADYWLVFQYITNKCFHHLIIPGRKDLFSERVFKILKKRNDGTSHNLQMIRNPLHSFYRVVDLLDKTNDKLWSSIKNNLPISYNDKQPRIENKKKIPLNNGYSVKNDIAFTYPGNKKSLIEPIIKHLNLPKNGKLLEPFAGSAAVSMALRVIRPDVEIWINEASYSVYAIHKTIQDNVEFLIDCIHRIPPNEETWLEYKHKLFEEANIHEHAWMFYYLLMHSFHRQGNRFCLRAEKDLIKKLANASKSLQGVKITNCDFREVMNNRDWTHYVDPPYLDKPNSIHYHPFSEQDHSELAALLMKKSNWLMSHSHSKRIFDLYEGCDFTQVKFYRAKSGHIQEYLIRRKEITHEVSVLKLK